MKTVHSCLLQNVQPGSQVTLWSSLSNWQQITTNKTNTSIWSVNSCVVFFVLQLAVIFPFRKSINGLILWEQKQKKILRYQYHVCCKQCFWSLMSMASIASTGLADKISEQQYGRTNCASTKPSIALHWLFGFHYQVLLQLAGSFLSKYNNQWPTFGDTTTTSRARNHLW